MFRSFCAIAETNVGNLIDFCENDRVQTRSEDEIESLLSIIIIGLIKRMRKFEFVIYEIEIRDFIIFKEKIFEK